MCISPRLFPLVLGTTLLACGGDLTLPGEGPPAAILKVESGDGQEGTVGRKLEDPLVVKLTDASSQPIEGVRVVFQFTSEVPDAEVDPEALTGSDGRASAEVRLGSTTGTLLVEARVATPTTLNATFVLTALEEEEKKKKKKGGGDDDDEDDDD
jgi:hypothetical protein